MRRELSRRPMEIESPCGRVILDIVIGMQTLKATDIGLSCRQAGFLSKITLRPTKISHQSGLQAKTD